MKNKLWVLILGLLGLGIGIKLISSPASIAFPVSQVSDETLSQSEEIMSDEMITAQTQFGFKLFNQLTQTSENTNIFISPSSIILAMSMLYNGADGETQQEMQKTLEYQGMSLPEVNQANQILQQQLNQTNSEIQLAVANSLWLRKGMTVEADFLDNNQTFYDAEVAELDFSSPEASQRMNNWVKNKTQGKIDQMIDQVNPNDVMFLINAIYFKGDWTLKFQESQTQNQPFYLADGTEKQHPLMFQNNRFPYLETEKMQGIILPYGEDRRLSLYVFLPKPDSSMSDFLQMLTVEQWEEWLKQFSPKKGNIYLPKFTLEYGIELKPILKELGMTASFTPGEANFSKLTASEEIFVSFIKHKTFLDVNEEGTEAAASTAIGITRTSLDPTPFEMIVNRPFFCAIYDNQTGTILFMGAIYNPETP